MTEHSNNVQRLYLQLRQMAADFEFKPQERINESTLSKTLNASRTPLREALNRLVAEGYLTFHAGRGFFCRPLDPDNIAHLYEARVAVECEALHLAIDRASDTAIAALRAELDRTEPDYALSTDAAQLVQMDEAFHLALAELSGNPELANMLRNINGRIRFVRMIGLKTLPRNADNPSDMSAHRRIVEALVARDRTTALPVLRAHIERRRDQTIEAVREAYAQLYVSSE